MLFFVDESWQTIDGQDVGALGGVVVPARRYNAFCREVFAIKAASLRATELTDAEFKGQDCFAKAAFKREELHHDSYWLKAVRELFVALNKYGAGCFAIWTQSPELLDLRSPRSTSLSKPYKQLLFDLRAYMRNEGGGRLGTLNFDQRDYRQDEATARALSNFLIRTSGKTDNRWDRYFITVPSFTVSSISPGLQAADVVSYLAAHRAVPAARPELAPYVERMEALRYVHYRAGRKVHCIRKVN